jgi:hypothetical protein
VEDESRITAGALVTVEVIIMCMDLYTWQAHAASQRTRTLENKPETVRAAPSKKKPAKKGGPSKKGKKLKIKIKTSSAGVSDTNDTTADPVEASSSRNSDGKDEAPADDEGGDDNDIRDGFANSDDSADDLNPDGGAHKSDASDASDDETHVKPERKETRAFKEDMTSPFAHCPLFPDAKMEQWWVFIGDTRTKELKSGVVKVTNLQQEVTIEIPIRAPSKGKHALTLHVISDSYLGHEVLEVINMNVLEAEMDDMPPEEPPSDEDKHLSRDDDFDLNSSSDDDDDDSLS